MTRTIRAIADAFLAGVVARALLSLLLTAALAAASPTQPLAVFDARVFQLLTPVALAILVRLVAPFWAAWIESRASDLAAIPPVTKHGAYVLVGTAFVVIPLLTVVALWATVLVRAAIAQSWFEAQSFLEPSYYSFLVTTYGPEVLAGALLLGLARHIPEQ